MALPSYSPATNAGGAPSGAETVAHPRLTSERIAIPSKPAVFMPCPPHLRQDGMRDMAGSSTPYGHGPMALLDVSQMAGGRSILPALDNPPPLF